MTATHADLTGTALAGRGRRLRQRGLSLIEFMVAITIGLFMVGGLGMVFVNMKHSFSSQDSLAQLQDSQRLALIVLTTTIEAAGYFPDPLNNTVVTDLPAASSAYGSLVAGQGLVGQSSHTGASDTITTRYMTANGDGLMNCLGQTNTSGANAVFVNSFSVVGSQLLCSTDGGSTLTVIADNVSSMTIAYGVDTTGLGTAYSYQNADAVQAAGLWTQVKTVRLTLQFVNPFAGQPGQPASLPWVQTVNVMNKA